MNDNLQNLSVQCFSEVERSVRVRIHKIVGDRNGNKDVASIEIHYGKWKRIEIPAMKFNELSFGWVLNEIKEDTAPGQCRGCIVGSIKRFFHIT